MALASLSLALMCPVAAAGFVILDSWMPAVGWGYLGVLILGTLSCGALTIRSCHRYQRLRKVTRLQELLDRFQRAARPDDDRLVRRAFEDYLAALERRSDGEVCAAINRVRSRFNDYVGAGRLDMDAIESRLLGLLDRRADVLIETRALQTAIGTALASRMFDLIIVLWQSAALAGEISRLYTGHPGAWGTLQLLRRGMAMVVFAEVAQLAAQAAAALVVQAPVARLGGQFVNGMANGMLILRFGEAVRQQCRPVPAPPRNGVGRFLQVLKNSLCAERPETPGGL